MLTLADRLRAQISQLEASLEEARHDLSEHLGEREPIGLTLPDVIRRQAGYGQRYPTGIPTLDAKTGGGIPRGRVVVIVGKPGVGKTSLAIQMAIHMASQPARAAVLGLFADSGIDDAALTIAQQLGVSREDALDGTDSAVAAVTREGFGLQLVMPDPDRPYSLDDLAARFVASLPSEVAPVLVLDSAQVLRCPEAQGRTMFDRVAAVTNYVKRLTDRHRLITLLVSRSKRASYANRAVSKDEDPLASGAGGGGLEYEPDLHLALDRPLIDGKPGPISLRCGKSRLGETDWAIELALDFPHHRHYEIDAAASIAANDTLVSEKHLKALSEAKERCLAVARRNPEGLSSSRFEELCGGRSAVHREARRALWESCDLLCEERPGRGGGTVWKPTLSKGHAA